VAKEWRKKRAGGQSVRSLKATSRKKKKKAAKLHKTSYSQMQTTHFYKGEVWESSRVEAHKMKEGRAEAGRREGR